MSRTLFTHTHLTRSHPSRYLVLCVSFIVALSALGATKIRTTTLVQDSYERRLTQLNESNPVDYYELGELLIADDSDPSHIRLGLQTLVIGLVLAQQQGDHELAASICIALAANEPAPHRVTNLWDLAYQLDPARRSAWENHRSLGYVDLERTILDASLCIAAARNGDEKIASDLFAEQTVRDQIRIAATRSGEDPRVIVSLIDQLIAEARDDDCRGRVFSTLREDGEIRRVVCQEHARPIGSAPSEEALRSLIKVEHQLIVQSGQGGGQTSESQWATTTYLELNAPARELTVEQIATMYQVDLKKRLWRANQWVSSR